MTKTILIDLVDTIVGLPFSPKNKLTEYIDGKSSKDIQNLAYSICQDHPGLSIEQFLTLFSDSVHAEGSLKDTISEVWIHSAEGAHYLPHVPETLTTLSAKGYTLVLVSNGAPPTSLTIQKLGLEALFDSIILSYDVGATKPDARIFQAALSAASAHPKNAWMVGDKLQSDIMGARRAGIAGILVNPKASGPSINTLQEDPVAEVATFSQLVGVLDRLEQMRIASH